MKPAPTDSLARWPALVLFAALGAFCSAIARAAASALPDADAQVTAMVMAFGLALGAALFAFRPRWHAADRSEAVHAAAITAFALLLPCAALGWLGLLTVAPRAPSALLALPLALPLACAGCGAAAVLARGGAGYRAQAAVWLLAAGLGAASATLLLASVGLPRVLAGACALAAVAAFAHARRLALRGLLLLTAGFSLAACALGPRLARLPEQAAVPAELRALRSAAGQRGFALAERMERWDAHGRTQSFELIEGGGRATDLGALVHDSALVAPLLRATTAGDGQLADLCERTLLSRAFEHAASARRVLLAGIGGGLELQCAVRTSASRIDVAEPSAARLAAVRDFQGDGAAAADPRVRHHRVAPRAFARSRGHGGYDLVMLPFARSKHTLSPGVLPVAEPLVETDAGLRELLSALSPGGMLWTIVHGEPTALRFAITAEKALLALGARTPNAHVVVHRSGDAHGIAVFRSPLDISRVLALHRRAKQAQAAGARGDRPQAPNTSAALEELLRFPLSEPELRYTPGAAFDNHFGVLFASAGKAAPQTRRRAYAFDIAAPSDNRPLFREHTRRDRSDTWAEASAYRVLPRLGLTALLVALGLVLFGAARMRPRPSARAGVAFGSLGAAQVLSFAFVQHGLGLVSVRPGHAFALAALALPLLALPPLPQRIAPRELPWAAATQALLAAAAVPLAPTLVLLSGYGAVAVASVLLLATSAAAAWLFPRRAEQAATAALVSLLACASAGSGCAARAEPEPLSAPPGWSVAILPDTQFYACAYPHIFERQAQWIAQARDTHGIALALHTGDIVDADDHAQWQVAADSMQHLRGTVPFLVTSGNHDLQQDRASLFGDYFDAHELARYDWVAQARASDRLDDSYAIVELAGRRWLFIGLEFGPRDDSVRWASEVLSAHADLPAVLFTHAYLYSDGTRYDRSRQGAQPYHPDVYALTPEQGIHDGEDLWRALVEPHENVRLVVSGHVIPDGTARASSRRTSGSVVHELLANYQTCDFCPCAEVEGGGGYLRLLSFDEAGTSIRVTTYSPYLDRSLTDAENDFVLELD